MKVTDRLLTRKRGRGFYNLKLSKVYGAEVRKKGINQTLERAGNLGILLKTVKKHLPSSTIDESSGN